MSSLTESDLKTLGNVTGFNSQFWYPLQSTVAMQGYVLGTSGLLSTTYTASILDNNDPGWMALPLDSSSSCTPRLYSFSDCLRLPVGAPKLGPYQSE